MHIKHLCSGYAPPEYIKNQIVSKEFDIFSLGVIIIKIIGGPTGHASIADMKADEFLEHVRKCYLFVSVSGPFDILLLTC